MYRDREIKDERDEVREPGANGDDRKGEFTVPLRLLPDKPF